MSALSNFVIMEPIRVVNLGAAEWKVISKLCGKEWVEDPDGYWPADTPKPGTWNGGRTPPRR